MSAPEPAREDALHAARAMRWALPPDTDRPGPPAIQPGEPATRPPEREELLAVEEPLELRIAGIPLVTLMRTPGSDRHLALGYFFTEGWIASPRDIGALVLCGQLEPEPASASNVVDLIPAGPVPRARLEREARRTPSVSSCGVCGKRTIEEVFARTPLAAGEGDGPSLRLPGQRSAPLAATRLLELPDRLRSGQRLFGATGSVHAAGLFARDGAPLRIEEDVGRHNAVDKVIGWSLLEGARLEDAVLFVSGRVSFEIVQKAFRAGLSFVGAISGVSSLAVRLAEAAGMSVAGFVRGSAFTVYAGHDGIQP